MRFHYFFSPIVMFYESVPIQIRFCYEYSGESAQFGWNCARIHYDLRITLDHAARKLRNQLRISEEYAKCSTNWARINKNPRRIATIREIFSHNSYKQGPSMYYDGNFWYFGF